jgi:hypothetical protein
MPVCQNRNCLWVTLLVFQHLFYITGRAFDDLSWFNIGITVEILEAVSFCFMLASLLLKISRKHFYEFDGCIETLSTLFGKSQLKFIISWSLTGLNCFLFINIFLCWPVLPEGDYFYVNSVGCGWNMAQIVITNLNYSLAANDKSQLSEVIVYEVILFSEMIYNGYLLIIFIDNLIDSQKDFGLLYIVLIITNQILIMDLIFRFGYLKNEKDKELKHKIK